MSKQLTIDNSLSTLIPNGVYDAKFKRQMLSNLNEYKQLKSPAIFEDQIQEDLINLWCVEKSDINIIKKSIAPETVVHKNSHYLKALLKQSTDGIYVSKEEDFICLTVIKHHKLQLFNRLKYTTKVDALYFILLYQDQFGINDDIYLSQSYDASNRTFINDHLGNVKSFNDLNLKKVKIDTISCAVAELCE